MDYTKQVTTLEQAILLHQLQVKQVSAFYYVQDKVPTNPNLHYYGWRQEDMPVFISFGKKSELSTSNLHFEHSAFTVAELGVMIGPDLYLPTNKGKYGWWISNVRQPDFERLANSESEARASMLIHLLEKNILPLDEVNQRLTA